MRNTPIGYQVFYFWKLPYYFWSALSPIPCRICLPIRQYHLPQRFNFVLFETLEGMPPTRRSFVRVICVPVRKCITKALSEITEGAGKGHIITLESCQRFLSEHFWAQGCLYGWEKRRFGWLACCYLYHGKQLTYKRKAKKQGSLCFCKRRDPGNVKKAQWITAFFCAHWFFPCLGVPTGNLGVD